MQIQNFNDHCDTIIPSAHMIYCNHTTKDCIQNLQKLSVKKIWAGPNFLKKS